MKHIVPGVNSIKDRMRGFHGTNFNIKLKVLDFHVVYVIQWLQVAASVSCEEEIFMGKIGFREKHESRKLF